MTNDKKGPPQYEPGAKLDLLDPLSSLTQLQSERRYQFVICHLSFVISNRRPLSRFTTFYRG